MGHCKVNASGGLRTAITGDPDEIKGYRQVEMPRQIGGKDECSLEHNQKVQMPARIVGGYFCSNSPDLCGNSFRGIDRPQDWLGRPYDHKNSLNFVFL
jgi:hypothetical protein